MRQLSDEQKKRMRKRFNLLLDRLRSGVIFVEGKKDARALQRIGCNTIFTISGNLKYSCERVSKLGIKSVIVLTDMDERGEELAKEARDELERCNIKADLETRRVLSRLFCLKEFELIDKKYDEVLSELEE